MANIQVVAIKPGFYPSTMRAVGARFTIASEKDFSENWMRHDKPAPRAGKGVSHTAQHKDG